MLKTSSLSLQALLIATTLISTPTEKAFASYIADNCPKAQTTDLNRIYETLGNGETQIFSVDIESPGWLMLEATANPRKTQPKLGFLGSNCTDQTEAITKKTFSSIHGMITELEQPGTYYFRVAARNSQEELDVYQIQIGFIEKFLNPRPPADLIPSPRLPIHHHLQRNLPTTSNSGTESEDNEHGREIDPELTTNPIIFVQNSGTESEDNEHGREIDPELTTNPIIFVQNSGTESEDNEHGREIDPELTTNPIIFVQNSGTESEDNEHGREIDPELTPYRFDDQGQTRFAGCRDLLADDHAAGLFCASSLRVGHQAFGRLTGADDLDALTFSLDEQSSVRLEVVGEASLTAEIFDESGHRISLLQASEMSWTPTLSAGRYFLRLSADEENTMLHYGVALEVASW